MTSDYNPIPGRPLDQRAWNSLLGGMCDNLTAQGMQLPSNLTEAFQSLYNVLERQGHAPAFEPRKVNPPGGYLAFRSVAAGLFSVMGEAELKAAVGAQPVPTEITALSIAYKILSYRVPVYFVADQFIRAVAATELPLDFTLGDLHWPMPAMVLAFPTQFMREYLGREVCYVNCARFDPGEVGKSDLFPSLPSVETPNAKVAWHWYTVTDRNLESYVSAYHATDKMSEAFTKYDYVDYTDGDGSKVASDRAVSDKLTSLIFKLLIILNTRTNLVVPGAVSRPAKLKHGRPRAELWSPNIIGGTYKVIRGVPQGGTHASPRWHWRRGHITHQRRGAFKNPDFVPVSALPRTEQGEINWDVVTPEQREKFWACHERRWVDPVLVNFAEEESK